MVQTRVVVYLNQTPNKKQANGTGKTEFFQYGGEVSVLNDKTLRLLCSQNSGKPQVFVAQKLHFDALSSQKNDEHREREISTLLHTLFMDRKDCLLMHLSAERGYHLMFLVDTLIIQVNVKLQQESLQLESCAIRYKQLVEGASPHGLDTQCNFCDIKHLMGWLLNEYRMRTAVAMGHEALEVQYMVASKSHGVRFTVKFHILLVAIEEMCIGTLCGLRCYLSHDPLTAALSVTELTTYIRQAAEENSNKPLYMLLVCHVLVTGCQVNCKNVQLLGLAHLAYRKQDSTQDRIEAVNIIPAANLPKTDAMILLKELKVCHQEINDRFQSLHDQLLTYIQQEQQLSHTQCQILKDRNELYATLCASESKLTHLRNLVGNVARN
ncbi:PREDICTED: uncharacterized protein LOC108608917 [Drosophila arizonae]|uniref:Uncharacterized protein LOC108608917 n=1 Tax=Drosophila arizonae TaxID=7263 RepID=A0ABM1NM56_DROAR|nr:PREDICTED: uncharacterized protein LOC108608917 [Drosophila arizonae]